MRVACKSNLVSKRLSFSLLHGNKDSVFTVGLLQLVWTVPVCRIWKFSCPLISDYIDDKKLVNLRASNIIGKLMGGGPPHPPCGNSNMQSWNSCGFLPNKS